MNTFNHSFIMVGLPETGKTTFLAALYHVLEKRIVAGSLHLAAIPEKRDYLNVIRERWCDCLPQERTLTNTVFEVTLSVADQACTSANAVIFPDVHGELFNQQYAHREWSPSFDGRVQSAHGILLFVHPGKVREPVTIREEQDLAAVVLSDEDVPFPAAAQPTPDTTDEAEWSPELAPTQVELVELLQFVLYRRGSDSPVSLAVMVSAWDLARTTSSSPAAWIRERLPLLSQYLRSNSGRLRTRYYGVSAQGGDLELQKAALQVVVEPSERIDILGERARPHDITAPLRWLMDNK
jgi:Double-GTPase 1